MAKLDKKTALKLLGQVVKEFGPDYRLPGLCTYFEEDINLVATDKPSCIVGQVIARWGNPDAIALFKRYNGCGVRAEIFEEFLTPGAQAVLNAAQEVQDGWDYTDDGHEIHKTWGEALKAARRA